MATLVLVVLVFLVGAGVVLGLYFGATKLPSYLQQRKLSSRLEEVTASKDDDPSDGDQLVKTKHDGVFPGLDRFATGTESGLRLAVWIEQAGVRLSISG